MIKSQARQLSPHQVALKSTILTVLASTLLLMLLVKDGLLWGDSGLWLYVFLFIPAVYLGMIVIFKKFTKSGLLIVSDTAHKDSNLGAELARIRLTSNSNLHSNTQGIFGLNRDGIVTFANSAMCDMLGFSQVELVGQNHHEMAHHQYADGTHFPQEDCPVYHAIRAGLYSQGEEDYIRKDGSFLPVSYVCSPIIENGVNKGGIVFFRDISRDRAIEQQLGLASQVIDNLVEGVVVTDAERNIISINPAITRITGYVCEEVVDKNVVLFKSEEHDNTFYTDLWKKVEKHGTWQGEFIHQHKNGEVYQQWLNISQIRNDDLAVTHYIGTFTDISDLKVTQKKLHHMAHHDGLTDLPNRLLFKDRLDQAIKHARRESVHLAVLFLDLDHFKHVNDTLGHTVGDDLLHQIGGRLSGILREGDTLARLGGDEFIVLLENVDDKGDAALVARKLLAVLNQPFQVKDNELYVGASIGISVFPDDGQDSDTLIKNADVSMYQAKEMGRSTFQFYTQAFTNASAERLHLESELRSALSKNQLELYYQPQVMLNGGSRLGVEALLRWKHPQLGAISPNKFIPIAEESGLILPIGDWVLQQACHDFQDWQKRGLTIDRVSVNISGAQVRSGNVVESVTRALQQNSMSAQYLELEITESFIMGQEERSIAVLEGLKKLGVSLSIDDFGTGYSSLSYLSRLPIDRLKVDQSFLVGVPENDNHAAIVRAIIALGKSLHLPVIAEGVETQQQKEFLVETGCDLAQGFLYSKPIHNDDLIEWSLTFNVTPLA